MGLCRELCKAKIEIAKNSLNKGLPIELINEITGLDMETIQTLGETLKIS